MTQELFQQTLRRYIHQSPFMPFVVTLQDGNRIVIEKPAVVFNGRAAGYLSPSDDLIDFSCEQVQKMEVLQPEMQP